VLCCRCLLNSYMCSVKKMACDILELMAEGLKIQQKNAFSKLLRDKESDSVFRVNHYPACPELAVNGQNMIGFGEHTDPQIISLLRSNNTSGLQIYLRDGSWISVPPDHNSFFINVGDSLQVQHKPCYWCTPKTSSSRNKNLIFLITFLFIWISRKNNTNSPFGCLFENVCAQILVHLITITSSLGL